MSSRLSAGQGKPVVRYQFDRGAAQWVAEADPDGWLRSEEIAQLADVSIATLENWRKNWHKKKLGPPFNYQGPRMCRYRRGDVVIWLRSFVAKPIITPSRLHLDRRAGGLAHWIAEDDPDGFLKAKKVAQLAGVSLVTLETWRKKRFGPPWVRLGPRLIRYRRGDLIVWLRLRNEQFEMPPMNRG